MTDCFEIDKFSIVVSLNERTIYVKVTDRVLFLCYEANIDSKELRLSIELNNVFQLMSKCFRKDDGYGVSMSVNSGTMKIIFNALVEGFLKISFEIILREKVMSNDGQLTLTFNKQEQAIQQLTKRLAQLENLVEAISYAEIGIFNGNSVNNNQGSGCLGRWKLNTTEIRLLGNDIDFTKIKLFYQLQKLTLHAVTPLHTPNFKIITNETVKELILDTINDGNFTSLDGLAGFPRLEILTIKSCPQLRDVVKVFSSYKHKIKSIDIISCGGINNTEIMTYCQKNNIKLNLA
jgi:hypothetical protein